MEIAVDPLPCGKILRVTFIGMTWQTDAARFRGQRDFEVRRDFEEIIWYLHEIHDTVTVHVHAGVYQCSAQEGMFPHPLPLRGSVNFSPKLILH